MNTSPFAMSGSLNTLTVLVYLLSTSLLPASSIPGDSRIGSAPPELHRLLLSPLEDGAVSNLGTYKLSAPSAQVDPNLEAKAGIHVLRFSGEAQSGGAKGDFDIIANPPGDIRELGMWVHLAPDANVDRVGLQIYDAEGEGLMALVPADWEGWKWVEFNLLDGTTFVPAFKQADKNGQVDFPLKKVNIVWFAPQGGSSSLAVDALTALSHIESPSEPYTANAISPPWGEPGTPFRGQVLIHNFTDKPLELDVKASLQSNPAYHTPILPDPLFGSDHLQGRPSWFEIKGERIDDSSLTDRDDESTFQPAFPKEGLNEIFQFADLGETRPVNAISCRPGDSNWIRKVDVSASVDGKTFTPVEGLQNLDLHKKWNFQTFSLPQPTPLRYLRLRYHNDGENLPPYFRALSSLLVYDGLADESIDIPRVGKEIHSEKVRALVPPRQFAILPISATPPLGPDAYLFGLAIGHGGRTEITTTDYFVMPSSAVTLRPESRFGMNINSPRYIPLLGRAGFAWVRFENMKWRFYNPAPDVFRFDGSVGPWHVPFDEYYRAFVDAGMSIIPYIFETPEWACSAPASIEKNRRAYPPRDTADYAQAIYQAVARYGSAKAPADKLLTPDKQSGLDLVHTYELWNEANLNDPAWGFFVGSLAEYYPLFRAGAEAAKQADPSAVVTNGGWAGIALDLIDTMTTYRYPDGKSPLDFTDILNVHYYTGRQEPELATSDPNANRSGQAGPENVPTLEDNLIALADWRDQLKPGLPIWVTEMGYDVGGPIGLTERHQAAKLPRSTLLSFANAIEKMFIFREAGSTPAHHVGAGILRNDGSLRPSFFTMATLIRQFDKVTDTRADRLALPDNKAWAYYWSRPGGDLLTVWAPEGEARLGLNLGKCKVTNAFGAESEETITEDFPLGYFPLYITAIENPTPLENLRREASSRNEARKKRLAAAAELDAYLFDFGSREFVGARIVGKNRPFTPVLMEDTFGEENGFGFLGEVRGKNQAAHWVKSPLEKDSIQLHGPTVFRVNAKPGIYEIQLKGENFRNDSELTIRGARSGDVNIPLKSGKNAPPTETTTIVIEEDMPIEFHFPPGDVQWLSLIEKAPES